MFAIPVSKVTGISVGVLVLVAGLLMTATAYFGMKSLMILSAVAVPAIAILGSTSVGMAIDSVGGISGLMNIAPETTMTMSAAVAVVVGSFISGGTLTPDFTRFAKNKRIGVSTTVIAFLIGNTLMFAFGAIGAMVTGEADISEVMFIQGLIIPAIIVLGLNIWTTNDNALYASGLGFSNITKQPKNKLVVINGIVGTLLAVTLYNNFMTWLNLLNTCMPSVGGVIIADYFIVNKGKYKDLEKADIKGVNGIGIVAWALGALAANFLPGITPINAVVTAIVSYVLLTACMKRIKVGKVVTE